MRHTAKSIVFRILDSLRKYFVPDTVFYASASTVSNSITESGRSKITGLFKYVRAILIWLICLFFALSISGVIIYRFLPPAITPLMVIRANGKLMSGKKPVLKKQWVSIDNISPNMVLAVVASEDNRFTEHFGFDLEAIREAQDQSKYRHRGRGASTISQQTAKNVFLFPTRSYIRKGMEVYFTLLIEIFWSKQRIMEVYLNMIEMGDGIYGAEAAARKYFHKHASTLTRQEAALIAAVLPNPRRWKPDKPTPYVLNRQQWILWNMNNVEKVEF